MIHSISSAISHFYLSSKSKSQELDGKRQAVVLHLNSIRLSNLVGEIEQTGLALPSLRYITNALFISAIAKVAVFPIFRISFSTIKDRSYVLLKIYDLLNYADEQLGKLGNIIAPITGTAYLVSCISMIVFNRLAHGVIGFGGLLLIFAKQNGYLPAKYDSFFNLVGGFTSIYKTIYGNTPLLIKIYMVLFSLNGFIHRLSKYDFSPSYLSPQLIASPANRADSFSIEDFVRSSKAQDKDFTQLRFQTNPVSFRAQKAAQQLPTDFSETLQKVSLEDLYAKIEAKQKKHNISLNQKGWNRLKNAVLHRRVEDATPPNLEKVIYYLKGVLFLCAEETIPLDEFRSKVMDLAEAGSQCYEGWVRDVGFLLNPKSKDIEWIVHHLHAKFRGELIKESARKTIQKLTQKLPQKEQDLFFSSLGEIGGVHFNNEMQIALAHRWHSHDAQVQLSIHGQSIIERLLWKALSQDIQDPLPKNLLEVFCINSYQTYFLPLDIYHKIHRKTYESYTPWALVDMFYEKIKPQYRQTNIYTLQFSRKKDWDKIQQRLSNIPEEHYTKGENYTLQFSARKEWDEFLGLLSDIPEESYTKTSRFANESFREIDWDAVCSWISEVSKKGIQIENEEGYNPFWVELDPYGKPFLTDDGVLLLLWDLGILKAILKQVD